MRFSSVYHWPMPFHLLQLHHCPLHRWLLHLCLDNQAIDTLLASLSEEFVLQDERTIENYLGINITKVQNPSTGDIDTTFTQTGINSILTDLKLNLTDPLHKPCNPANPQATPMADVLHPSPDAEPYDPWDVPYQSIIGKLNFLAQHTWPDIAYAINSCAHYLNAPNKTHFTAVKWIRHYLLGTQDKGLILHPTNENCLSAYVDSNFVGSWSKQVSHLHHSALSHTGYVITYSGCPIHWVSKLQSKIALNTCKAEYIVLSMCTRALIPLCQPSWWCHPSGFSHPTKPLVWTLSTPPSQQLNFSLPFVETMQHVLSLPLIQYPLPGLAPATSPSNGTISGTKSSPVPSKLKKLKPHSTGPTSLPSLLASKNFASCKSCF